MFRIKNTAEDRTKHLLHRTAAKFELEPTLGGTRIRLGSYLDVADEHYERVKPIVDEWVKKGMVEVIDLDPSRGDRLAKWKSLESYVEVAIKQEKEELSPPSQITVESPKEPEVLPEPSVIVEPEPPVIAPPVVQAPPPPPVSNRPPAQDPNKIRKLR